jgi:phage antirepressor YoqD-like protein
MSGIEDKYYLPIIYLVKRHGSINSAAKSLKISQQKLFYWNKQKHIPDEWKVILHKKYEIPYKKYFEQLE